MSYTRKVYKEIGGDKQIVASGGEVEVQSGGILDVQSGAIPVGLALNVRARATAAQINGAGGYTILQALAGYKYRIVDMTMIAIGGAAQTATSVDIVTTQGGSAARPFVVAVAALTQSAVVKPNSANVTVLADGASFIANDANTGVYISKQAAGSNLATATHIDINLTYVIEAA